MTSETPPATKGVTEALCELTTRAENFWAFIQGEYGVRLSSADQDDHNVYEFFSALEDANAALAALSLPPLGEGEAGWIVGNGAGTMWRKWTGLGPTWTDSRDQATRYARRQDAEAVHEADEDAWTVELYAGPLGHDWFEYKNMKCCQKCGNVWNETSDTRPCKGSPRVRTRSTPAAPELAVKPLIKMPGAEEAFAALDLADRLIERGYGNETPKEWHKAYRAVAEARAASSQQGEKA
jgi:hypothetical protein